VINVITRRPGDEPGTYVFAGYGNYGQIRGQLTHSGRKGIVGYRLSAGYDRTDRYTTYFPSNAVDRRSYFDDPDLGFEIVRASAAARVHAAPAVSIDLEGGVTHAQAVTSARATLDDVYTVGPWTHLMATLNTDWGYLRTYWNFLDAAGNVDSGRLPADFTWHTVDAEGAFSRAFHFVWDHNVTLGVAYRKKIIEWNYLGPEPFDEDHYAAFFQDTMNFGEHVSFVASLRTDSHPLLDTLQLSPRGALVLRPTDQTSVRLSAGRAFRTQTFLESYLDLRIPSAIAGVSAQGYGAERNEALFGARDLRPEQIVSTEIGFRYVGTDYFDVDLAAYYNRVTDLVRYDPVELFTLHQAASGLGGYDETTGTYLAG
ncbi:MAG: TonB-dependent receptor, partial [Polyangiaceae bacterium]|nr:TonB-dependent receptor [Polyangiaceae bacterium]